MTDEQQFEDVSALVLFEALETEFLTLANHHIDHLNAREIALAKTNMEQAGMWIHRALQHKFKPDVLEVPVQRCWNSVEQRWEPFLQQNQTQNSGLDVDSETSKNA